MKADKLIKYLSSCSPHSTLLTKSFFFNLWESWCQMSLVIACIFIVSCILDVLFIFDNLYCQNVKKKANFEVYFIILVTPFTHHILHLRVSGHILYSICVKCDAEYFKEFKDNFLQPTFTQNQASTNLQHILYSHNPFTSLYIPVSQC